MLDLQSAGGREKLNKCTFSKPSGSITATITLNTLWFWLIRYRVLWTAFTMETDYRTDRTRPGPLRGKGYRFCSTGWIT